MTKATTKTAPNGSTEVDSQEGSSTLVKAAPTRRGANKQTSNGNGSSEVTTQKIVIDHIKAETLLVPIIGTSPLIMHRFSEKAKKKMLDTMQARKSPREPKDPQAEYEAAFHRLKDGTPGFPVLGFKQATVGAARFYHGVKMTELRQFIFFRGEPGNDGLPLTRIIGEAEMREDAVGLGGKGSTDLRYRPIFHEWSATLEVTYVTAAITRGSVLSLIDAGGMGVGVGEWRVERNGVFGTYRIDPDWEVQVLS